MLKIRLMRIGAKKRPFYRVVVVDERAKRTGAYIELMGTYNPLTEPKEIKLKQDRIDHWTKQGAQLSDGFLRIIGKAPQKPPRKPKKEKKVEKPSVVSDQSSDETNKTEVIEEAKPQEDSSVIPSATEGSSTSESNPSLEDSSPAKPDQNDNTSEPETPLEETETPKPVEEK